MGWRRYIRSPGRHTFRFHIVLREHDINESTGLSASSCLPTLPDSVSAQTSLLQAWVAPLDKTCRDARSALRLLILCLLGVADLIILQIVAVLLLVLELANTVLTCRDGSSLRTDDSIAAAVLTCASMLSVIAITYAEHRRSPRSSSFLSAFLTITMLFNVARARSYISRGGLDSFGALQVAIAIAKLALVALEEVPKQSPFRSEHGRSSIGPETRGGFWNRSLFVWVNNTLLIGFRNAISVDELPEMGPEFSTERLSSQFQEKWETG